MTPEPPASPPASPPAGDPIAQPIKPATATPAQLAWLADESADWVQLGLISDSQAEVIRARYVPGRAVNLARILLTLGAAFFGFGVIWLVAANLDQFSPLFRFVIVACFWIAATVIAEWLASRRQHQLAAGARNGKLLPSPVVGAARIVATAGFGASIAQAAQSLQVPAYEPKLLGLFALGALIYAYAVRAVGPLVIGAVGAFAWVVWSLAELSDDIADVAVPLFAFGLAALGLSALHRRFGSGFSSAWRDLGWAVVLGTLFFAALPFNQGIDEINLRLVGSVIVGLGVLLAGSALVVERGIDRIEVLAAASAVVAGLVLLWWEAPTETATATTWARASVAVIAYVAAAGWVAVSGTVREDWRMIAISLFAVVGFTTAQSFAVFAELIQGAWLFLVLGAVFLATGYFFDRARREFADQLEDQLVSKGRTGSQGSE